MVYPDLHINQFYPKKKSEVNAVLITVAALVVAKLRSKWLKRNASKSLIKSFRKYQIRNERILEFIPQLNRKQAEEIKLSIPEIVSDFQEIYNKLEKINFFDNKELETLSINTLSEYYRIDAKLDDVILADKPTNPNDSYLFEFASELSLGSLSA